MSEDSRIHELMLRLGERLKRGQSVSIEDLRKDYPDLAAHLLHRLESSAKPLQDETLRDTSQDDAADEEPQHSTTTNSTAASSDASTEPRSGLEAKTRYTELEFLARGGLGEVFVGTEAELNRQVALKLLHTDLCEDDDSLDRFTTEAEITSRLDHPGIVAVHGMGTSPEGRPFYAMRLIQGNTLKRAIDAFHDRNKTERVKVESSVEFRNLLTAFVSVCKTVAYAHNRGIVHLDIKPDNIMLGKFGEALVVDWGLASAVERDEQARATGERTLRLGSEIQEPGEIEKGAGSPFYMSPEQIPGSAHPIGPPSDVYGLGATLFYLLTGKPSVIGTTVAEIWERKRNRQVLEPSRVNGKVPRELEAICTKALAHVPDQRYTTPLELAEDIERWLADKPVSVHRPSALERVGRWMRHHRTWAMSLAVGLVALVFLSTLAAFIFGDMAESERSAREAIDRARQEGIRVSARYAAKTVANEIELRWRILEGAAADSDFRRILEKAEQGELMDADQRSLQSWLDARFAENQSATKASSWFVNNRKGIHIARSPFSELAFGRNYSFRDYFHGQGRDLDPNTDKEIAPIRNVHLSCTFKSQADFAYKVAFTVPVWSGAVGTPNRRVLGVLGMSVEVGHFAALQDGLGSKQLAILVDTRKDWLDEERNEGLILHHPHLAKRQAEHAVDGDSETFRIDANLVAHLRDLRRQRLLWEKSATTGGSDNPFQERIHKMSLDTDYRDPLEAEPRRPWLAAFEPVLVSGRPDDIRDTGLVVIVQESE